MMRSSHEMTLLAAALISILPQMGIAQVGVTENGPELRASRVCGGIRDGRFVGTGLVEIEGVKIKGNSNGSVTIIEKDIYIRPSSFEEYQKCLIVIITLLTDNSRSAPSIPKVFNHADVSREGRLLHPKITIIPNGKGEGSFNVDFNWTGSPGTWSGNQTAVAILLGENNAILQSITISINRTGCFYGEGNHQSLDGPLTVNPELITGVSITLSEVRNRNEGGC